MLRPTQYHFRKTETATQGCFEAEINGKSEACKKKNRCSGKQNATKSVSFRNTFSITSNFQNKLASTGFSYNKIIAAPLSGDAPMTPKGMISKF